jgi:putative nucleotidyltransferase with HDIG domain
MTSVEDTSMELDIRKEIVLNIKKLPTLPIIFEKVLETIDDPKSSATILQETIKNDQSITAKVLSMASSAFYGYSQRVSDLSRAIVILGFDMVKNIALSVSVFGIFPPKNGEDLFDREQFWLHSIASGYIGKVIADRIHFFEPDKAFIACLLHDIGKVVLDSYFENEYVEVINTVAKEKISFFEAEQKILGCDHSEIGFILGEKLNFPEELLTAIKYHHVPSQAPRRYAPLTYLTYVTNLFCQEEKIGKGGSILPVNIEDQAYSILNLKPSHLKQIRDNLKGTREKLEALLQVMN